jgi:hypothetical protein
LESKYMICAIARKLQHGLKNRHQQHHPQVANSLDLGSELTKKLIAN